MDTDKNTEETALITLETKLIRLGRARDKSDTALKASKEHVMRSHAHTRISLRLILGKHSCKFKLWWKTLNVFTGNILTPVILKCTGLQGHYLGSPARLS